MEDLLVKGESSSGSSWAWNQSGAGSVSLSIIESKSNLEKNLPLPPKLEQLVGPGGSRVTPARES